MLTRLEVDEAEAETNSHEAEANSDETEAKAKIALFSQILHFHFNPIFSKNQIFGRFSTRLQKFSLKTGFNMGTLLVNTPKWPATPLDADYCFCVYTLNRKMPYLKC